MGSFVGWGAGVMLTGVLLVAGAAAGEEGAPMALKSHSVLYPGDLVEKAKANAGAYPWAGEMQRNLVAAAEKWLNMSDEELWGLMFGPRISRSWMVWSDGFCPGCKKDVRMYTWEINVWEMPWKVRCPHCKETFPKNDFAAYHRSGYDEHGVFDPARADRALLFNVEHPDATDPLHMFGVDDGEGYVDSEGHRWRFIGCYLIYGQWKQWIYLGIVNLSNAYLVTGDPRYARKAAILLDRAADVFPGFEFAEQGLVYETRQSVRGQVSTWHDACAEITQIALAYDRIFESARSQEKELVEFLSKKSGEFRLENPKATWGDIQRNIEVNIFQNTLEHRSRIESNYPTTDRALATIKAVLNWPENRDEVLGLLDGIIVKSTAVDGMSGEKGLAGYTTIAPRNVAEILAQFSRLEPGFLRTMIERHPALYQTYRFHIDLWHRAEFYPQSGDTGGFGKKCPVYMGVHLDKNPGTDPSMFAFLWDLYEVTKDPAFVQVLYQGNGGTPADLPHDLFAADPMAFQSQVKEIVDQNGADVTAPSVNKTQWRIAMLRSGRGDLERALWIDYDSGERHSHADGMNIGLFAKGLDLIPEFGYPAVGYGGWGAPKGVWYTKTAAHSTVMVDGQDQKRVCSGVTKFWAAGQRFHGLRASDPAMIAGKRYERTVALIDLDDRDSYVLDYFLVEGGKDHAKFFRSHFGTVAASGSDLSDAAAGRFQSRSATDGANRDVGNVALPAEGLGAGLEMRNFRCDPSPAPGWSVDWTVEDRYKYLPEPRDIHVRYTDFTTGASAWLAESWVDTGMYGGDETFYVPTVMARRTGTGEAPLLSAFVSVIEPYEGASKLAQIRRLQLSDSAGAPLADPAACLEFQRTDGARDVCVITAEEHGNEAVETANGIRVQAALGWVQFDANGPRRLVVCQGTRLEAGPVVLELTVAVEFIEIEIEGDNAKVVAGDAAAVGALRRGGTAVKIAR